MGTATLTLTSGQLVIINYSFSFGEMAIICALLVVDALLAVRFVYDVSMQLWSQRKVRVVDDDSD